MVVQGRGADEDPKETTIAAPAEGEVNMNTILNFGIYKISSDGQREEREDKGSKYDDLTLLRF